MSYDELIKRLRECGGDGSACLQCGAWSCGRCIAAKKEIMLKAADAIEKLRKLETPTHVYGYPVEELIAFAIACRKYGVKNEDLQTFAFNLEFAFMILQDDIEESMKRVFSGVPDLRPLSEPPGETEESK